MIKYHDLAANLLIFPNVVTMTRAPQAPIVEAVKLMERPWPAFSPYQAEHINRFGRYTLKRDRSPETLDRLRVVQMPPRSRDSGGKD